MDDGSFRHNTYNVEEIYYDIPFVLLLLLCTYHTQETLFKSGLPLLYILLARLIFRAQIKKVVY
jgi:hypothetical protein